MLRSVAAVFAGFVVLNAVAWLGGDLLAALFHLKTTTGPLPAAWPLANLVVRLLGAFLAGLAAAHIATGHRLAHAGALAGLMLLLALITLTAPLPEGQALPRWYLPALAIAAPLAALAGGIVRTRARAREATLPETPAGPRPVA